MNREAFLPIYILWPELKNNIYTCNYKYTKLISWMININNTNNLIIYIYSYCYNTKPVPIISISIKIVKQEKN